MFKVFVNVWTNDGIDMIRIENECVGCPPEMGCLGSCCPKRNVKRIYCDICGEEIDYDSSRWDDSVDYHVCEDCEPDEEEEECE